MTFIEIAEEYLMEGFNPLPLKENKAPKLPVGHDFLYNKIDKIEIRFKNCEKIGIACGDVSGGFYALDFDKHKGQDIEPLFNDFFNNQFIQRLINVNKIAVFKTPSGGYHFYFRFNKTLPGKTLTRWDDGQTQIEIRGNGQYLCVFPSVGYEHVTKIDLVEIVYIEEFEYENLINIVNSFSKEHEIIENKEQSEKRTWKGEWDNNTVDGKFNNNDGEAIAKKLLEDIGWSYHSTRKSDNVELWTRPGKSIDDGISATWGKHKKMFFVFSENANPFKAKTAYNPFQIYTLLKFNGDWKKAKDSLKPIEIVEQETEIEQNHEFFPIEVFPEFIRNYILELKRTLNFHVDFSAAAAMFTVATINGNKYKLRVKNGWDATTIFWFACVGYPGTIKTHPVKTLTRPLSLIDKISKSMYDKEMLMYDPDEKKKTPKPKFKQMLISDYTIEALHSIHDINKRGIGLYKDELKGFLNDMNKYRKGSDEEFWLESFNNGSYIVNRVTKEPIMVNNICINMIGTIQHDVLNKVITENSGNGLIDRFLFTASENKVYPISDHEIDDYYFDTWRKLISAVDYHFKYIDENDTETLLMEPDVFEIYKKIDKNFVDIQNSDEYSQEIKNYLSKMKTYVPRFALLLAIMESICDGVCIEISKTHMMNAEKIAKYFIKTAQDAFSLQNAQKDIKEVESSLKGFKKADKIQELIYRGFKKSELSKYFNVSKQYLSKFKTEKVQK